ncbi:MAG: hypothetical protein HY925_09590 [Elusimicrobia bacterium]|nr:hypothetical protein [Elusimicrobiota bacterium]
MSRQVNRELDKLLEETRHRIRALSVDVPELEAIPPPPPPKSSGPSTPFHWTRGRALAASAAGAAIAYGVLSFAGVRPSPLVKSAPLAMDRAVGLVLRGDALLSLDPSRELLVTVGPGGEALGVARLVEPDATGLAGADDGLWTASMGGRIALHNNKPGMPVEKAYAAPGRSPQALAWDGLLLWVSDPVAGSVYEYASRGDLAPIRELPLPGLKPVALHKGRELLWVLDGPTRTLRRYRVGPLPVAVDELALGPYLDPQARVAALAVGEDSMWVITQTPVLLHRFTLSRLPWKPTPKPFAAP